MPNFLMTHPFGTRIFLDQDGGTSGNTGEGGGNANDQNSQDQTSGGGSGEGGTGGTQKATSSAGDAQVASPSKQGSDQTASGSDDGKGKDWQAEYNKLAGNIRTNETRVNTARANEAKANQAAATATQDRDKEIDRANAADQENMRLKKILDAGIPGNLAKLVTGTDEATVDSQIKEIQTTLIGSAGGDNQAGNQQGGNTGNDQGSDSGNGSSGGGSGQTQGSQDNGKGDGNQDQGNQQTGNQQTQTSQDGSGSTTKPGDKPGPPGHTPPKPAGQAGDPFLDRFQKGDSHDRHKLMQDVIEGRTVPDWEKK